MRALDQIEEALDTRDPISVHGVAAQLGTDRKLLVNGKQFDYYRRVALARPRSSLCFLPVVQPWGRMAIALLIITTVTDLTYTAFMVPLSVAFAKETLGEGGGYLAIGDVIGNVVYAFDLLAGFHIGFVVQWDARFVTIMSGRLVAWWYVRHGPFLINFIAVMPMFLQVSLFASGDDSNGLLHLVYMLRLLRLTRVWSLIQALSRPGERGMLSSWVQGLVPQFYILVFNAFLSLLVLLNLLGCIWWAIAEWQGLEDSWVVETASKADLVTASSPVRYLYSVYFVMTTITTIGYGDITPYTTLEVGVTLVFMIIGVAYFGYIINVMAALLDTTQPRKRAAMLQEKMQTLDGWMQARALPSQLRRRLRVYFLERWLQQTETEEASLYADLPTDLKLEVQDQLRNEQTVKAKQLPELSSSTRANLSAAIQAEAVPVSVFPGHVIYSRGEDASHFYVLDDGVMSASSGSMWPAAIFSGPAIIGLAAVFGTRVPECAHHGQTLTAVNGCHLWRVSCMKVGRRLLDRHPEALQELAKFLAQRLRTLLALTSGPLVIGLAAVTGEPRQQQALIRLGRVAEALDGVVQELERLLQFRQRLRQDLGPENGLDRAFSTGWAEPGVCSGAGAVATTAVAVAEAGAAMKHGPSQQGTASGPALAVPEELQRANSEPALPATPLLGASAAVAGVQAPAASAVPTWLVSFAQPSPAAAPEVASGASARDLVSRAQETLEVRQESTASTTNFFGGLHRSTDLSPGGSAGEEGSFGPRSISPQATRINMAAGFSSRFDLLPMGARELSQRLEMHDVLLAVVGGEESDEGRRSD